MSCNNCNIEITSKFCPACGQPKDLKRIDGKYILHEIEHILHVERGILYTIKQLFISPGNNIRTYLSTNRSRLVKPVIFVIVTSLIYTIISRFFHIEEEVLTYQGLEKSAIGSILKWIQGNYGYASILTGVFIGFWLKIFFKKYGYNFYELLIMQCFVQGISMLIFAIFAVLEGITDIKLLSVAGMLGVAYITYAMGNFFEEKKASSYIKALISFLLGTITFYLIIIIIGVTIDIIKK